MARAWFRPARTRFSGLGRVCVLLAGGGRGTRIMGAARDRGYCRFPATGTSLHGKSDLNSLDNH